MSRSALIASYAVCGALVAHGLGAQGFGEVELNTPVVVNYSFGTNNPNDVLPNQDGRLRTVPGHGSYSPLLDVRRKLLANSWVGRVVLTGPLVSDLELSLDECVEDQVSTMGRPCTPTPAEQIDRLEIGWVGAAPSSQLFFGQINGAVAAGEERPGLDTGWVTSPTGAVNTMMNPGALLRFVSGPPVPYNPAIPWRSLTNPPIGEGTGFLVDQIQLQPTQTGAQGPRAPSVLQPYDQGSGILLGGATATSQDSVYFRIAGSANPQTVAIWFPVTETGGTTHDIAAFGRCGVEPGPGPGESAVSARSSNTTTPLFLDMGSCPAGWHVSVVSTGVQNSVFHFTIAEHFDRANRSLERMRVGIEFPVSGPTEATLIRQTVRRAAWQFYGATGGSFLVRSITYNPPGSCSEVHFCWRNRPGLAGCSPGAAVAAPVHGSMHLCAQPRLENVAADAATIAHEMGHAFAHLPDEYWRSHNLAQICGFGGVQIRRCSHSMMGYEFNNRVALCVGDSHDQVPEFFIQSPGEAPSGAGQNPWMRGPFNVLGPQTITECSNGQVNRAGPYAPPAWTTLFAAGVAPYEHPGWTPSNFNYLVFANSAARTEIGNNLD